MKKIVFLFSLFLLGAFFVGKTQTITYTPQTAAGYQFKYLKADSGIAIPLIDTSLRRGVNRIGAMVARPQDSVIYFWNGQKWGKVSTDITGLTALINAKVDSLTVSGSILYYWKNGVAYGVSLSLLSGTLQTVTDNGSVTTNSITVNNLQANGFVNGTQTGPGGFIFRTNVTNTFADSLKGYIQGDSLQGTNRTWQLPDTSGVFALSVNGTKANKNGNVVVSVGTVTSVSGVAPIEVNSFSIATPVISMKKASATDSGWVSTGTQTIAGAKTFSSNITASITGNAATATALQTARTIGTTTGDATSAGSTFDGSANNTNALTLATVNSNVGTFTNSTITVNGKGLITAASSGTGVGTVTSVAALTLGTTGTDLSSTVANGTTTPVITLQVPTASATNRGALSSADWTTFNNKGSVSSIATNNTTGITGGTITTSGTLAIDTTVISTRKWRQKGIDSVQANLTTGLALKVNISDTSSMLSSYFRKVDTASLSNRINLKLNISDTSSMLSPYARTNSVNAGLALKVNISDTATMLTSYLRKVDTTAMLSPYKTFYPRTAISLTTTGNSGAATYNNSTGILNVPVYTDAFTGTVTSVATNNGSGITGGTITTSGTLAIDTLLISTRAWRQKGIDSVVALIPSTTGYVPYTGATQDVDLDAFKLNAQSLHIKGTGGNGHLGLKHQSASATASANEVSLFADNLGNLSWLNGNLYLSKFITSGNTAARSYTFPNATGTIALTSDLTGYLTSVTATSPLSSSGGTTPNITIAQATTSVNGYLSSTDWTTFNGKESVLTFSSPLVRTTNTISIPVATTSVNGYLSSADWTTFNGKQSTISLTTTGTSGAATFTSNTLNIPQYQGVLTNPVTGTGTTNYLPKFTGASALGNSLVSDNGTRVTIDGDFRVALADANINLQGTSKSYLLQIVDSDNRFRIYDNTSNVERLTITSAGNVGIGSTPSAWNSIYKVAEIGTAAIFGTSSYNSAAFSTNVFYNSGNSARYIANDFSNMYWQDDGNHIWYNAPSGTAGNAITFTQAMTLNASGNLSIGNTNDTYKLDVNGTGRFSSTLNVFNGNIIVRNDIGSTYRGLSIGATTSDASEYGYIKYQPNVGELKIWGSPASFGGKTTFWNNDIQWLNVSSANALSFTGAATFSSSVTASQGNFNQIGNAFAINMTNRNNNQTWGLIVDADAVDDKILGFQSSYGFTPFYALKLEASGGAATFSSSIKTAAPSGGTAKPFKIGAAATVTPTSQNRTIEIEIDGVTYYLTAKTTND